MNRYEIVLYWSEEDNAFIAEVPQLAGGSADGATRKDALDNVEIIIQEWTETAQEIGREFPIPHRRLESA
ncbi:MAG: type II toxin-antitoxin system HicB family antitoxin [Oscillospiraceae bacterium]|nr:type II toxin-antitoxin system HicB family antitoxin [Oscillospiraceae bacterium]